MLPTVHRMRRSTDFSSVVRAGFRARAGRVVVHHVPSLGVVIPSAGVPSAGVAAGSASFDPPAPALVGFVVSKAVGNSVQRHGVTRRLRAQTAARLDRLSPASGTVVRALPGAASASSAELGFDLDRALSRLALPRPVSAP